MTEKQRFEEIDLEEFRTKVSESATEADRAVKEELSQKLVIGIIGNVSSGKGALTNAIFGERVADVHPIAGWSKEVKLYELQFAPGVFLADTPGLEDVDATISEGTEKYQDECDMFVYVVNGAVGCTRADSKAFSMLCDTGRPVAAVLNKKDAIRGTPQQVEEFLRHTREQLGAVQHSYFATSADPDPRLYDAPEGIGPLTDWLLETAGKLGKELLMAKAVQAKRGAAKRVINTAVTLATGAGALPIPGSDYLTLTGIQVGMLMRLSHVYEKPVGKEDIVKFIGQVLCSGVGKHLYKLGIQVLKGAGWLGGPWGAAIVATLAGSIAGAITYGLGWAWAHNLESDFSSSVDEMLEIFEQRYRQKRKD
jgi:GTPase